MCLDTQGGQPRRQRLVREPDVVGDRSIAEADHGDVPADRPHVVDLGDGPRFAGGRGVISTAPPLR